MNSIDLSVNCVLQRLRESRASTTKIAEATGIGVATIWALRKADSVEDVKVTLRTLRRLAIFLDQADRAASCEIDARRGAA